MIKMIDPNRKTCPIMPAPPPEACAKTVAIINYLFTGPTGAPAAPAPGVTVPFI